MSSFGSPGGGKLTTKPTPPQRGSFPLDHDGECKSIMTKYLGCLKNVRGVNDEACRELAKGYLTCRMDNNLMARDDFKNLGFKGGESKATACPLPVATAAAEATTATPSNNANVAGGQGSSK